MQSQEDLERSITHFEVRLESYKKKALPHNEAGAKGMIGTLERLLEQVKRESHPKVKQLEQEIKEELSRRRQHIKSFDTVNEGGNTSVPPFRK